MVYRPAWGIEDPVAVKIKDMTETEEPREKHGSDVSETSWDMIVENRVCFGFDNGYWGYSDQVDVEESKKLQEMMGKPVQDWPAFLGISPAIDASISKELASCR